MQLDRVVVEDFRGIDRLAIELDELTTVIGEPDGGKSSLLRAIGRVLDPELGDSPPPFKAADFHRRAADESERATVLSIALGLRADDDDPLLPEDERLRNGLKDGGVALLVVAVRHEDAEPTTTVSLVDRAGAEIEGADAAGLLTALRQHHPAVIVGGPRPSIARDHAGDHRAASRLRTLLLGAAQPDAPLTWDQLVDVREDLVEAAGALADELGPPEDRRRSVREMTETPGALETDLGAALEDDAGQQRRIAALWLLVSILDALPAGGIGRQALPILLFDDIEANLHPTWLAAYTSVALNLPFQKVVATHSPAVLGWVPLSSVRRLVRDAGEVEVRQVHPAGYTDDEMRRLTYHLRMRRGSSFFARCWVLVEGETEAWLVPEFARLAGVEFPIEGIGIIEFAQAGFLPLARLAEDLGIGWVLLADGDEAGQHYARAARAYPVGRSGGRVVVLPVRDIEHYLFANGYADVIRRAAGRSRKRKADELISAAVKNASKPGLALRILAEADERGPDGVPPLLRELAETARQLARG